MPLIRDERRGDVALITLDRPERRNAVDAEACRALATAVVAASAEGARAVVLTGAGGSFCAGADLGGVRDEGFTVALRAALDALVESPLPVIAAVEGVALGAGTQLAVACDLRVAAPSARFGVPAAKLGLMVDHWTVQRVATLAGAGPARAMLLAVEEVDGEAAVRLGLAQRLGSFDDALAWADHITTLAPLTLAGHKLSLNRIETASHGADVDGELTAAYRRAWSSQDVEEGMAAFRERRPPRFSGR